MFLFLFLFSMNLKKKENLYQGSLVLNSIHTKQNKLENKAKENEYMYSQGSLSILWTWISTVSSFVPGTDRSEQDSLSELFVLPDTELWKSANAKENTLRSKRRCRPMGQYVHRQAVQMYSPPEFSAPPRDNNFLNHCQTCLARKNFKN